MTDEVKKIAYLFGAGATHAELARIEAETASNKVGLTMKDVSKRVLLKAQNNPWFKDVKDFLGTEDNADVELLISLLEINANEIFDMREKSQTDNMIRELKDLVRRDITERTDERRADFILHRSLFELHKITRHREELVGLISLNYDTVLDEAYGEHYGEGADYSFSSKREKSKDSETDKIPLLKLHGSFDWENVDILGRSRQISIIPLGMDKKYLRLPYNFIWGRALEVLADCAILRVIGCSLSQNDIHLVDLLFKASVERKKPLEIEIISSKESGVEIKERYSFFPKVIPADQIKIPRLANVDRGSHPNVFLEWLRAMANSTAKPEDIAATKYLHKIAS